ncbi:MAG: hypothetical protein NZP34_10600, partial [Caldilineales bacterium]|nr:hypothetical protein [Caldilineales bacterium]
LNPLSHNHTGIPIFRNEVKAVFSILDELCRLQRCVVMEKGRPLFLAFQDPSGAWHNYKLELIEDLCTLKQGDKAAYLPAGARVTRYQRNKESWQDIDLAEENTLEEIFQQLQKKHKAALKGDYTDGLTTKDKEPLKKLLNQKA